ncbi:RHS repeat protein [Undibacterium sp. Ji42W]|uniref:RHS repeat protein n=1 Tax=Undibacterium sp. Ji42W TaxID=3413039 RepID=UPI003BF32175
MSTGAKTEEALDYSGAPDLDFVRDYRSDSQGWSNNFQVVGFDAAAAAQNGTSATMYSLLPCYAGVDTYFNEQYCFPQVSSAFTKPPGTVTNEFVQVRGNGRVQVFGNGNNFNPPADINDRVVQLFDGNGALAGWSVYKASTDATEFFDLNGRLLRIVQRNGMQKVFTYSDASTPLNIAPKAGLLLTVSNHFNQKLTFTYDLQGRMSTMKDPAGGITNYAYDEPSSIVVSGVPANNLTSVTYPDSKKRVYWYNEQDKTNGVNLPLALTGITDENGVRFATWTYDSAGRALSSEHAGGVEKFTFAGRGAGENPNFTDPLGVKTEFAYTPVLNQMKLYFERRTAGSNVLMKETGYDARGNISMMPDNKGNRTSYTYDVRNLEIKRVDAVDSYYDAITTTTSWHPQYRIPVQINTPLLKTSYTHDTNGNVLTKTEQATSDTNGSLGASAPVVGNARTWTYTYNTIGQVLTVTGPRTDVVDKTTYTYDNLGNLATVTNAAGHVTTLSNYDANSRAGQITDPNGLVTTLTYTPRGWLKQRVTNADGVSETTTYDYDGVGQMTKVTLPDNSSINYVYDDAHRLTKITDNLGNSINYTLDVMGNRVNETVTDTGGNLTRQVSRVYDILNRLQTVTGAAQ